MKVCFSNTFSYGCCRLRLNFGMNRIDNKQQQGNVCFFPVVCNCDGGGVLLPDVLDDGLHHLLPAVRLH